MGVALRQLSAEIVGEFKAIRLRALREDPAAFGRSYAEEMLLLESDWIERVSKWSNERTSITYLAWDGGSPCGIVAAYMDQEDARRAHVASMWVEPAHRRMGVGAALVKAVREWAEERSVSELQLIVTHSNRVAIQFYERQGLTLNGVTEPHPWHEELHVCHMVQLIERSSL